VPQEGGDLSLRTLGLEVYWSFCLSNDPAGFGYIPRVYVRGEPAHADWLVSAKLN